MERSLRGRRALVTGASRRLGRAIAHRLAEAGADVGLHYRKDEKGAEQTARDIERENGVRTAVLQGDLTDEHAGASLVDAAEAALGPLDLLVNNAAVFSRTPLDTLTVQDFDRFQATNARSVYVLSLEAGRRMKARGHGVIVNLVDVAGLRPWPAYVPYSASKGTVVNLTRGFARALAPEVRVNGVAPGPILPPTDETKPEGHAKAQGDVAVSKTLLGRWGDPSDIAEAVLFLATTPYVTGVVLPVDGGRSIQLS